MRHLYYCDGMITNWSTHWNDGAMWATGLERTGPVEIEGTGDVSAAGQLLERAAEVRGQDAVSPTASSGPTGPRSRTSRSKATDGWVYADFRTDQGRAGRSLARNGNPARTTSQFRLKSDKQDFIDCVKSRQETLEPAEVGHRVTSLGHLGHIAIQVGGKLRWDPEKERFLDNDAANAMIDKPIHGGTAKRQERREERGAGAEADINA